MKGTPEPCTGKEMLRVPPLWSPGGSLSASLFSSMGNPIERCRIASWNVDYRTVTLPVTLASALLPGQTPGSL